MASTRLLTPIFFNILLMCSLTVGSEIESCAAIRLFGRPRIIIFNTSICRGVKLNLLNFSLLALTEISFQETSLIISECENGPREHLRWLAFQYKTVSPAALTLRQISLLSSPLTTVSRTCG